MSASTFSDQEISLLIEHLLQHQDIATVGLRRIIKKKQNETDAFPVKEFSYPEFSVPSRKLFTEEEQKIIELEKKCIELQHKFDELKKKAQNAIQSAYCKGVNDGKIEGVNIGRLEAQQKYEEKISEIQKRVTNFLNQIGSAQKNLYLNSVHIVVKLACELAKKITLTELSINPNIIVSIVKKSLTYISERENIRIRVAPNDLKTISDNKNFWEPVNEKLLNVILEPDERIGAGGCIVESSSGVVDARVETQLNELTELIEKNWESLQLNIPKSSNIESKSQ